MELFRPPNTSRPKQLFDPAVAERKVCLKGWLRQIIDKASEDYDIQKDDYLIKGINNAVVNTDYLSGSYMLNCPNTNCEVNCVIVQKVDDPINSILILNPLVLDSCKHLT